MIGKLYGIGVGPGEAELLTLKALRIMRESDVIIVPGTDVRKKCGISDCAPGIPGDHRKNKGCGKDADDERSGALRREPSESGRGY